MAHAEFTSERREPGRSTSRERQAEQRRIQLIDIALDLFSEKGVDGATIKDIAAQAGVAQGLVYHYFDSKEALLLAVIERHGPIEPLRALLAQVFSQSAREGLSTLAHGAYHIMSARKKLLRVVLREALLRPEMRETMMQVRAQILAVVGAYLESRVAQGELRPHNTEVAMQTLAATVASLVLGGFPPDPFIDQLVEMMVKGLTASPADSGQERVDG
ncbi:MAG TPA: TetR/AcrR family transcriptional regulator [Ktedonobacterales bacterium]|nr:TetR/AcrR family transcriptional regulator [Ktedonobacterales bacterium]